MGIVNGWDVQADSDGVVTASSGPVTVEMLGPRGNGLGSTGAMHRDVIAEACAVHEAWEIATLGGWNYAWDGARLNVLVNTTIRGYIDGGEFTIVPPGTVPPPVQQKAFRIYGGVDDIPSGNSPNG